MLVIDDLRRVKKLQPRQVTLKVLAVIEFSVESGIREVSLERAIQ